jgi:exopolysaccharide biosynthesis protein
MLTFYDRIIRSIDFFRQNRERDQISKQERNKSVQMILNIRDWSWFKRMLLLVAVCAFLTSSFLFLTPPGENIRLFLAKTVITTQHRDWAWIFVGASRRDELVKEMQDLTEINSVEKQNLGAVKYDKNGRKLDSLVKVEDISGQFWKGKRMYVYDPTTIRVVVPSAQGQGERITSMVQRTKAVAGINAGGFDDPDGLGNGFAPIGVIMSGGNILYTDQEGSIAQQIVGFTKEGTLIIGKYTINELLKLNVTEAVSFYPRVIANGKPLITSGDGGWGRAPRTAIGQKADGTVIFIVIDGRQTQSVGATLKEVQDLFLQDDVINAGFLDGGASSEMVYDDKLITSPSSRYGERRLPSGFLVFDHPENVKVNNVWAGLTHIDPGGAYDHPEFLKEQAAKKNSQPKTTPKPTATPTMKSESTDNNESVKPTTSGEPNSSVKPGSSLEPKPTETSKPGASASPSASSTNNDGVQPLPTSSIPKQDQEPGPSASPVTGAVKGSTSPTAVPTTKNNG